MAIPGAGILAVTEDILRMYPLPAAFIRVPKSMQRSVAVSMWSFSIASALGRFSANRYSMKNIPALLISTDGSRPVESVHSRTLAAAPWVARSRQRELRSVLPRGC